MAGRIRLQSCGLEHSVFLYKDHVVSKEPSSFFFVKKKSEPFWDLDRFVSVAGMLRWTHSYAVGLNQKNDLNLEVLTQNPAHS